ncbi:hypothetical protein WDW37_02925 [Bdellovibrionota bacterium FG-1]
MTRNKNKSIFWIAFLSLNLVPIMAYGRPAIVVLPDERNPTPKPVAVKATKSKLNAVKATPAQEFKGPEHDLKMSAVKDVFLDFDAKTFGDSPHRGAKLMGQIFKDCEGRFEINFGERCPGGAVAFQITDRGGGEACMKSHIDKKDPCDRDSCRYLSQLGNGTINDLGNVPGHEIKLFTRNPNGNEENSASCEAFPVKLTYTNVADLNATLRRAEEERQARVVIIAERQVNSCFHNSAELAVAERACGVLAAIGTKYSSVEECILAANFPQKRLKINQDNLKKIAERAKHAKLDELDEVRTDLVSWINENPRQCEKGVDPLREIARRLATQKVKKSRNSDLDSDDALAGYDAGLEAIENSIDEASCLADSDKLNAIQTNLRVNRLDRFANTSGASDMSFRSEYYELSNDLMEDAQENCSGYEMDPSCKTTVNALNSMPMVSYDANMASQRMYQRAMIMQQQRYQMMQGMGGGGMNGGGQMGGVGGSYGFGRL